MGIETQVQGRLRPANREVIMSLRDEGTMNFWLSHKHKDWATNSSGYNFGTVKHEDILAEAVKHSDKTVEIKLIRPFYEVTTFRQHIPKCDQRGLMVSMSWKAHEVKLYLNGQLVETKSTEVPSD